MKTKSPPSLRTKPHYAPFTLDQVERLEAVLDCPLRDLSSFSLALAALEPADVAMVNTALLMGDCHGDQRRAVLRRWVDSQAVPS